MAKRSTNNTIAKRSTDNTMVKRSTDNTMTKRSTDNTMAKRSTDNTMAKRNTDNTMTKRVTDNTMAKRSTDNTMAKRSTDNTMAKRKETNNDLHNTTEKTKDWATQTPLNSGGNLRCSERVNNSCSTSGIRRVILVTNGTRKGSNWWQTEHVRGQLWNRHSVAFNQVMAAAV